MGRRPTVVVMRRCAVAATLLVTLLGAAGGACGSTGGGSSPSTTRASATGPTTARSTPASTTEATFTTPTIAPAVDTLLDHRVVLAHAGGDDDYPHSTAFAFGESAKAGVDVLDLDVQLSADGVLMVQHDDTVDRTTNGTGPVNSMTAAQLQALDNAYWFNTVCNTCQDRPAGDYIWRGVRTGSVAPPAGYTAADFAIPTFGSIATRFGEYPLNIEIKGTATDNVGMPTATALAAELHKLGREQSVVVTSFDDAVLASFHQQAPSVMLSPGLNATAAWVLGGTALPDGMRILQVPPEYQGVTVLTPDLVAKAHAAGYAVWVWPNGGQYENADGYQRLFAMGVDGIDASKPAAAVAAR
jgi:glycerophosphoryl diester phosphodiesterase